MRLLFCVAVASLCAGCAQYESVRFLPRPQQEAMVRDGQNALVSRKKTSIVLVRPASRQFAAGRRPVFVVGIYNLTAAPLEFRVNNVEAQQIINQQVAALKVMTYEELMTEERNRQIMAALLVGVASAANSVSASRAGYYNSNSTVYTPRGTYNVQTTGYSPTAAAIAQSNANAQNEAMIANTIETGQRNLATLEKEVIKDNTLLPGEWYGGQLVLAPPDDNGQGSRSYTIAFNIGADRHEIEIAQERVK